MLCFLMAWLYCSLLVSKPRERSSFWLQSAKHVQGQTKTHEPQACCWAAPLASFTHSQVLPPFQITSPLFQIITRFDFSRYIGYVRLEEFWRNFDGFEECWRNLWEKNTVPDKKKKRIKPDLRARKRITNNQRANLLNPFFFTST